jgi:hypothetical protein
MLGSEASDRSAPAPRTVDASACGSTRGLSLPIPFAFLSIQLLSFMI